MTFLKSFLKFISPVEITSAEVPAETLEAIDQDYKEKLEDLNDEEYKLKAINELMVNLINLVHVAATTASVVHLVIQHPSQMRRLNINPDDESAINELKLLKVKPDGNAVLDVLITDFLKSIFKRYPILETGVRLQTKNLFPKSGQNK